MKDQLIALMSRRLNESRENLKEQFFSEHPINVARYFVVDNFLPTELAEEIYVLFPKPSKMHSLNSYGELKLKCSYIKNTAELLQDLHYAFQSQNIISIIENITGISNQLPDTSRLAGGVSILLKGDYINPHLDTSHNVDKKLYRTINTLYYVSPNWKLEDGGNFELWDKSITHCITVPNLFNRLLVVETNRNSWHSVNPVLCNQPRCCVFNFYFSEHSPEAVDYFHDSSLLFNPLIRPRPEQTIRRGIVAIRDKIFRGLKWNYYA
jgi:Rps23 Pro-64 3,4-dihydroxylase Tpa1-like proline 4-hydroxylase